MEYDLPRDKNKTSSSSLTYTRTLYLFILLFSEEEVYFCTHFILDPFSLLTHRLLTVLSIFIHQNMSKYLEG